MSVMWVEPREYVCMVCRQRSTGSVVDTGGMSRNLPDGWRIGFARRGNIIGSEREVIVCSAKCQDRAEQEMGQ